MSSTLTRHLLVVIEDDESREIVVMTLEAAGYPVAAARSVEEATVVVASGEHPPAAVIFCGASPTRSMDLVRSLDETVEIAGVPKVLLSGMRTGVENVDHVVLLADLDGLLRAVSVAAAAR